MFDLFKQKQSNNIETETLKQKLYLEEMKVKYLENELNKVKGGLKKMPRELQRPNLDEEELENFDEEDKREDYKLKKQSTKSPPKDEVTIKEVAIDNILLNDKLNYVISLLHTIKDQARN